MPDPHLIVYPQNFRRCKGCRRLGSAVEFVSSFGCRGCGGRQLHSVTGDSVGLLDWLKFRLGMFGDVALYKGDGSNELELVVWQWVRILRGWR